MSSPHLYDGRKEFLTYLLMMEVFPVEELPMKRILHSLVMLPSGLWNRRTKGEGGELKKYRVG